MQRFLLIVSCFYLFTGFAYTQIIYGKNKITTVSEGVDRNYVVHVPLTYDGTKAVPLVFMLHGTGGSGEDFYENIGWKELSEKENFIAVYPSSLRYKIIDDVDGLKTTTKWNTPPDANFILAPGETGKDDIKFLRKVVQEISAKYKIDASRIYLDGFSNGGNMAAKCAIEMSDVLAAVCQNAASYFYDTTYIPKRKLPILYQVGDRDYGPGNEGPTAPMYLFDSLISTPNLPYLNGKHHRIALLHQQHFELKSEHTIEGDSSFALIATYLPRNPNDNHEFKYIFVKKLAHNYPNGAFHPFDSPKIHWDWMKQFTLQDSQSLKYNLTVINGQGSGKYEAGDTVHIWAETPPVTKVFGSWSGNVSGIDEKTNWHTTIVMPSQDVSVTAQFTNLPSNLSFNESLIDGPTSKKEIFSYFPDKDKIKGVVWFFSGSGGRGKLWVSRTEERELLKLLAANDYGIITLDAEEVTQDKDLNNDGTKAYHYDFDSINNPDLVNVKYFHKYFVNQNKFHLSTPQFSVGFSSGGGFSEVVAAIFHWAASLSHNTGVIDLLAQSSEVPHYQNNSQNDDGPNVGTAGNIKAAANMEKYASRNIKSQWILQQPQPLHSARFARIGGVTEAQSLQMFNFIKDKGLLDNSNYLKVDPEIIQEDFKANPSNYPALLALPQDILFDIFVQLKAVYTNHLFRSDFNGSALKFIDQFGKVITSNNDISMPSTESFFYPNPASSYIYFDNMVTFKIYDQQGKCLLKGVNDKVDISDLSNGFYLLNIGSVPKKLIILK